MRETGSPQTATQNNAMRNNYVKPKIDKMQPNSKYRLCGNRDERINLIIKRTKLAKKEYN